MTQGWYMASNSMKYAREPPYLMTYAIKLLYEVKCYANYGRVIFTADLDQNNYPPTGTVHTFHVHVELPEVSILN